MDPLSVDELVARAEELGYQVTQQQIQRWHRSGLLSRPIPKGLGRGKGTVYLYPEDTFPRLVDVIKLRDQSRSLTDIRWSLWWKGYEVDVELLRADLIRDIQDYRSSLAELISSDGRLSDEARTYLESQSRTPPSAVLRTISRRTGRERLANFLDGFIRIIFDDLQVDQEELKLVEHGLGIDAAMNDQVNGMSWLTHGLETIIAPIRKLLRPDYLQSVINELTIESLDQSKDRILLLSNMLITFSSFVEMYLKRWDFGLGAWGSMLEDLLSSPSGQKSFVVLIASLPGVLPSLDIDEAFQIIDQVNPAKEQLRAAVELAGKKPIIRKTATPQRVKSALNDPHKNEKLAKDIIQTLSGNSS